ncbi:hypothetical protein [Rhodococcus erythropolis]|uniref:hypothetical protein n=1 Tax=Rhodococcus erythropolis TaxID=1833 RepID=UPI000492E348|nr:hypothetical protein [Rhodococcus erythropolis]
MHSIVHVLPRLRTGRKQLDAHRSHHRAAFAPPCLPHSPDAAKHLAWERPDGGHRRSSRYQLRSVSRARELGAAGIALLQPAASTPISDNSDNEPGT